MSRGSYDPERELDLLRRARAMEAREVRWLLSHVGCWLAGVLFACLLGALLVDMGGGGK